MNYEYIIDSLSKHPFSGCVIDKAKADLEHLTIEEFDKISKEKGLKYWLGKSVVIDAILAVKPDNILIANETGERQEAPSASISSSLDTNKMFISFVISREVNSFLNEYVEIGEALSVEFNNIDDVKVYHDPNSPNDTGYYISVKVNGRIGPNILHDFNK